MNLLVIDTAGPVCAIGLSRPGVGRVGRDGRATIDHAQTALMARGHGDVVMDFITTVLARGGCTFRDIGKIVVTTGPGSFTGQRVGIATARGLALGLGCPVVGVSVLEALRVEADIMARNQETWVGAINDARRGEVYMLIASRDGEGAGTLAACLAYDEALTRLLPGAGVVVGSGAEGIVSHLPANDRTRVRIGHNRAHADLAILAQLGANLDARDAPAVPLYLRPPDAKPRAPALPRAGAGDAGS